MWPDRVSNPVPLTYESGALPTALRPGPNSGHIVEALKLSASSFSRDSKGNVFIMVLKGFEARETHDGTVGAIVFKETQKGTVGLGIFSLGS